MNLAETVERAKGLNKHAVAKLVALFEDTRTSAAAQRAEVLALLPEGSATVIGITGTPGAGKSSLVARLVPRMLAESDLSVAVLAVDPSSHVSGGHCWATGRAPDSRPGTNARTSAVSRTRPSSGLAPTTFQVSRLLKRLFDVVLVETVGIGQSELDIRYLADHVYLVLQPLGGDEIQFLKAGIIEIPDSFILNKCDDPAAGMSYYQLRSSLSLARPFDEDQPPVYKTSARRRGGRRGGHGHAHGDASPHRRRARGVLLRPLGRGRVGRDRAAVHGWPKPAGRRFRPGTGGVRRRHCAVADESLNENDHLMVDFIQPFRRPAPAAS